MATPTWTLAGLRTEFDALITAAEAGNWDSAYLKLIRVRAVIGSLPSTLQTEGQVLSIRSQVDEITKLIEKAKENEGVATDRQRRLLATRVAHRA